MEFSKSFRLIAFIVTLGCISIARLVHTQDQIEAAAPTNEYYSVSFSGIVDAIDDRSKLLDGSVTKGTEISGYYCINTENMKKNELQPNQTSFFDAVGRDCFEMRIGNYTFRPAEKLNFVSQITIADNLKSSNDTIDLWKLDFPLVQVIGNEIKDELGAYIHFSDTKGEALNNRDFVPSPNLSDFNSRRVGISRIVTTNSSTHNSFLITGEITSIR